MKSSNPRKKSIITVVIIVFSAIFFYALLINYRQTSETVKKFFSIFAPFIIGGCLAFILNAPMKFFETRVFAKLSKKNGKIWSKLRRPLCIVISILIFSVIIALLMLLIIPKMRDTIVGFVSDLPTHMAWLQGQLESLLAFFNISSNVFGELHFDWETVSKKLVEYLSQDQSETISTIFGVTSSVIGGLVNALIGFVFSIYILASKERHGAQVRRVVYSMCSKENADRAFRVSTMASRAFGRFMMGQCTEAVLIGGLSYLGMLIISPSNAIVVASIVCVTALIPMFGPIIGTVLGAFIILFDNPIRALWFVIFILVLQQIDNNLIYPRIMGKSVGLPGILVLFSVTIGGSLLGVVGMLISVPICTVAYTLVNEWTERRLREKSLVINEVCVPDSVPEKFFAEEPEHIDIIEVEQNVPGASEDDTPADDIPSESACDTAESFLREHASAAEIPSETAAEQEQEAVNAEAAAETTPPVSEPNTEPNTAGQNNKKPKRKKKK